MKKLIKLIPLALFTVFALLLLNACGIDDIVPSHVTEAPLNTPRPNAASDGSDSSDSQVTVDMPSEDVPMARAPAIPIVLMPEASGTLTESNSKAVIDYSNSADGYIMVKWLTNTTKQLRVQITGPSDVVYTYTIQADNDFNVLPLSDGSGSYTIRVFEQAEGSNYALALSHTINVSLIDEFAPFLRPNKIISFDEGSAVVAKAASLVSADYSLIEKVGAVYDFIINNFTYDTQFAEEVLAGGHKGYIPVLDDVLARQYGICFDYAAVMTGMLRSQGIPTKLVEGFAGDVHHAWISVFSEETGWVDQLVFFDGENWIFMDPTFAAAANSSAALAAFIGDGGNYSVMFLF